MKSIFASFLMLASATVASARIESVQTLMPMAGQSELVPSAKYLNYKIAYETGAESTISGATTDVTYYYGITDSHALGFEWGFVTMKSESTFVGSGKSESTAEGMNDLLINYKGNYETSSAGFFWGLGYSFSPEERVMKSPNSGNIDNWVSGQSAYVFSAAVVVPVSTWKLGSSLRYRMKQAGEETVERPTETYKMEKTGGSVLESRLFVEAPVFLQPNLAFVNLRTESTESRTSSGNRTASSSGSDLFGIEIAARYSFNANVEIVPQLAYYQDQRALQANASESHYVQAGAAMRLVF